MISQFLAALISLCSKVMYFLNIQFHSLVSGCLFIIMIVCCCWITENKLFFRVLKGVIFYSQCINTSATVLKWINSIYN